MTCWKCNISRVNVRAHIVIEVVFPSCPRNGLICGLNCIVVGMKEILAIFTRFPVPTVALRVMKATDTLQAMISVTLAFSFIRVDLILIFRVTNSSTTAISHGKRTIGLTTQATFLSAIRPINHTRFENKPTLLLTSIPTLATSTRPPPYSSHPPCHTGIKVPFSKVISLVVICPYPNSTVRHLKDDLTCRSVVKKRHTFHYRLLAP
mmetsp:Transcript_18663/g.26583  ORF Transcript_18663/g.26583 Transcript_18663/m.26583 type:complete len:207 (+) Transcript_18663:288-908(+)